MLPKTSARKAPQKPAGKSDGGWHTEDLLCEERRVFVEDDLASLFEMVLHASGVDLQDLAQENETSADESASSAREE